MLKFTDYLLEKSSNVVSPAKLKKMWDKVLKDIDFMKRSHGNYAGTSIKNEYTKLSKLVTQIQDMQLKGLGNADTNYDIQKLFSDAYNIIVYTLKPNFGRIADDLGGDSGDDLGDSFSYKNEYILDDIRDNIRDYSRLSVDAPNASSTSKSSATQKTGGSSTNATKIFTSNGKILDKLDKQYQAIGKWLDKTHRIRNYGAGSFGGELANLSGAAMSLDSSLNTAYVEGVTKQRIQTILTRIDKFEEEVNKLNFDDLKVSHATFETMRKLVRSFKPEDGLGKPPMGGR